MSDEKHEVVASADMLPATEFLHPLVEKMMAHEPTPENLEKLMQLQREHQAEMAKREFARALVGLKKDLPPWIKHDKKVDYSGKGSRVMYTHSSMAQVLTVVQPILCNYGFAVNSIPGQEGPKVKVTVQLKHQRGHQETSSLTADPDNSGSKNPAQAIASTITYLTRYITCSLLGIATSDMNEPGPSAAPENDLERIDTDRNLKAAAALEKKGIRKAQAEKLVGKNFNEWTVGDLGRIREKWFSPKAQEEPPESDRQLGKLQMDSLRGYMKAYPNAIHDDAEALELFGHGLKRQLRKWSDITQADFDALKVLFDAIVKGDVIIEREPMRFTAVTEPGAGEGQTDIPF